ncbi:SIMPL domain-containing protein [Sphingobacterium sp. SYP-B4668]|uniref:SIMPL domain-containing protein n=1 Tax=Sphingobacterium sp. SYP-B4668 TaxID=2996035 RepID=UPI0022DD02B8|nr:SIMPL domain-containing protein [Sphingobacterium sp. SYP-B4668]
MKKIILSILILGMMGTTYAQQQIADNLRKVSTKGKAEREVTPDIIHLSVSLREYYLEGNTKKKVTIETLEKQLYDAALANGIKKEDFTIQNIWSYNPNDSKKKKNSELLQSRQYTLKVTDLSKLNTLFDDVDPKGLQNTAINEYDYSDKKELEKQLKVEAVNDAKINATILASAAGDKVGKALVINDNTNFNFNNFVPNVRAMAFKSADAMGGAAEQESLDIDIKPIKIYCEIDIVFELL